MQITVSRDIDAAPAAVWDVIVDIEGSPAVLSGVQHIERLDDAEDFRIGTRWRETRTMFGKQATEEMQVTAIDPGSSYTVTAVNGRTTYTSVLTVEALAEGRSRLIMRFGASSTGVVTRIMGATIGRLFQGASRRALERDLVDIAAAAEQPVT
ncbi:MAG: SRPBCC family protein [Nitriliruptoraceae bacterium]|nr:SRPBCC family protein [Nitriliruptoraceae bacterium]